MTRTWKPMPIYTAVLPLVTTARAWTRPRRLARLLAAVAVLGGLAIPGPINAQDEGIALGATPDPVVLETLDGEPVDLSELVGEKPVLLEFWATWCAVCRGLEPAMKAVQESFGERVEIVIVAAAVAQTKERVEQHLIRHPAPGRVLWDTGGRFTRAYDAPGTGYIVILDADGKVAYTGTGVDQDLMAAMTGVIEGK